jgi:hypothetical protein
VPAAVCFCVVFSKGAITQLTALVACVWSTAALTLSWGGVRYILDITIAWAPDVGAAEWRPVAYDADEKGKGKDRAYQAAMRREMEGGEGWFESMRCARTDHFIPLAYESNGEWGTRAKEFFKLVCEIAGTEGLEVLNAITGRR